MRVLFFLLISIVTFGQNVGTLPNSVTPIDTASYTLLAQPSATTLRKLSLNRLYNTMPLATSSISGRLSSIDWTTFNNKVSTTRTISTTSPITGGGDLSANRTIAINQATTSTDGYLSSADWNTFNGKANVLTLVTNATDANFTATLNGVHNILDGVATANRIITIPAGSNGDVMKFYNTEDTYIWSFTGATVYLADRVTVVTQLLYNVPCFLEKIDGRWIITN